MDTDDVWYHKMNDTVLDDKYQNNMKIMKQIFLTYDGYKKDEIPDYMPSLKERLEKRQNTKRIVDIPADFKVDIAKIEFKGGNVIKLRDEYR